MQHWDISKPLKLVSSYAFEINMFVLLKLRGTGEKGVCCSMIYLKLELFVLHQAVILFSVISFAHPYFDKLQSPDVCEAHTCLCN